MENNIQYGQDWFKDYSIKELEIKTKIMIIAELIGGGGFEADDLKDLKKRITNHFSDLENVFFGIKSISNEEEKELDINLGDLNDELETEIEKAIDNYETEKLIELKEDYWRNQL